MNNIQRYLDENRNNHLEELFHLLRIPSISASSEHKNDVKEAALFLEKSLHNAGMENVKVMETDGLPVVYGDWLHAKGKPTVLIYGHYDVQPVDPLELWDTPPFEPTIRDEKLYARGASDDKGQMFMHVKAVEAILKTNGELPVNIKFIIEGEEEIGSPSLPAFLDKYKDLLKADVTVISDTPLYEKGQPTICYGLRGLCGVQIDIKGTKGDLHSGLYGGGVPNAAKAIVDLLDSFHHEDGSVAVEGFYTDVLEITKEEKQAIAALNFDETTIKDSLEVTALPGEKDYSYIERTTARPTLEINGVYGGFQGEGIKTVIPAEAHAKISCRLVPNQDPDVILDKLKAHIDQYKPEGVTVSITPFDKGYPFITPIDHPVIQAAAKAYEAVYKKPTKFIRGGGSIPIVADFNQRLETPVVLMGFGLNDENFHAPNEHFHLENFDKGLSTISRYLFDLAAEF